jgi:AcrR family transcriptional regulator
VNDRWSTLIRQAATDGHTLADVAGAAGCARPSLYRHLRG